MPDKPGSLAKSTLAQILSSQQKGLGAARLQRLLDKKRKGRGRDDPPADRNDVDAGPNLEPRRPSLPSGPTSAAVQAATESRSTALLVTTSVTSHREDDDVVPRNFLLSPHRVRHQEATTKEEWTHQADAVRS